MYYIGAKSTLGHYSGIELLDGDVSKIEVADKTPDAGFDLNSAKTRPAYQGRPVLTEHVPTKVEWQESGPLPDVEIVHRMLIVPPKFREIVEKFEPGVHQFLPIDILDRRGKLLAKRFFFVACNRLDSVDRAHTVMILWKGMRWRPASDIARLRPQDIPIGFDISAPPKLVFNNAQIGNKHAWCDMFLMYGPYLSDALGSALEAENFNGIDLQQGEAV